MKALVGAFNKEKALVGAFSVIVQPVVEPMDRFTALLLGLGDLTAFADPREDPYLAAMDRDVGEEDEEDVEDFNIRSTDNLILAGHVEGDSSMLEVYVYNDVEDALYVHHDILLQSFPLALEWLSFDPENDKRGSLVAVNIFHVLAKIFCLFTFYDVIILL